MLRFIGGVVVLLLAMAVIGALFGNRTPRAPPAPATSTAATTAQRPAPTVTLRKTWQMARGTSAIDDSPTVQLSLEADSPIADRYGGLAFPMLLVWCRENRSGVAFRFGEHFVADLGSYGDVTYRVDARRAVTKGFRESTDNGALMLVSSEAIAFMKALFGAETLTVRAVPYNENALETTFSVANLETEIKPLREACHW